MEARRRLMIALLVPVGAWLGHALAYAIGGPPGAEVAGQHGYLGLAPTLTVPSALIAVTWWAAGRHGRRAALPGALSLAGAQGALFLVQEAIERLAAAGDPLAVLAAPVLWWGLVSQALVAGLVALLVRGARRTVEALRRRAATHPAPASAAAGATPAGRPSGRPRRTPVSRRGPPRPAVPA
jgi:hypothetical protein